LNSIGLVQIKEKFNRSFTADEKLLCEPWWNPLCNFVVKHNSFNHKGSRSKSQSNTKENQLLPFQTFPEF
jgi:hypothetical protein